MNQEVTFLLWCENFLTPRRANNETNIISAFEAAVATEVENSRKRR